GRGDANLFPKRVMNAIKATVKNGQILVAVPADWPEGCEVVIEPLSAETNTCGDEADAAATPEAIAKRLALMDQIEPLLMTPEEEAQWQEARRNRKEFEKTGFGEQAERLQ